MKKQFGVYHTLRNIGPTKLSLLLVPIFLSNALMLFFSSLTVITLTSCGSKEKTTVMDSLAVRYVYEFKITEPDYLSKFNTYLNDIGLEKHKTEAFIYLARKYSLHSYRGSGTGELYKPEAGGISGKTCITIGEVLLKNTSLIDSAHDFGLLNALNRLKQAKNEMSPYLAAWIPFNDKMIQYDAEKPAKSSLMLYTELKSQEKKIEQVAKKYSKEISAYECISNEIDKIVSKIDLSSVSGVMLSPMYLGGKLIKYGTWAGGDTVGCLEYGFKF